ncbi:hypothetical protein GCM10008083_02340 [Ulvibacter litoralis]|nr:hypothetical protein GCM10008083_02340 [Ulvibacter litoralis]
MVTFFGPDADVSYFFSMSEEENKDNGKQDKEVKTKFENISHIEGASDISLSLSVLPYHINYWNKVYFEINSPPPDRTIFAS